MVSDEKIEEIKKELMSLDPEEQQKKFQDILKELDPEEQKEVIEKLTGKKQGGCPFCSMAKGDISVTTVYEDSDLMAILDINPANKGHVLLFPKEHASVLAEVPDAIISKLFVVANKIAKNLFDKLDAKGTNIVVSNGQIAGQTAPHVLVNVIPRFEGDKVAIGWERKQIPEEELAETAKIIELKPEPKKAEVVSEEGIKEETRIP